MALVPVEACGGCGPCALVLPSKMDMKEGTELSGGIRLGKMLGAGVQARVFELVDEDGKPTDRVIKINHQDLAHKLLNNNIVWIGLEREWQIGQQLRVALQEPDGSLPGFMKVVDCLARTRGDDASRAQFNGMLMERLSGWEVWKRIDTPEFHNIHYVREMLFQVFSALDRAQRKLGFHHADLGMRNIMEHYPIRWEEARSKANAAVEAAAEEAAAAANLHHISPRPSAGGAAAGAAPEGCPCAAQVDGLEPRPSSSPRLSDSRYLSSRAVARCGLPQPRPGWSCNADGSRMPLGPHVEFKVIDFGVAAFNPTLAQAAGGYEYEEAMIRLEEALQRIASTPGAQRASGSATDAKLAAAAAAAVDGSNKSGSRRGAKSRGKGLKLVTSVGNLRNLGGLRPDERQIYDLELEPTGDANRYRITKPAASLAAACSYLRGGGPGGRVPAPGSRKVMMSPIEVMYRKFWNRKGDVYHILLSLAIVLDDRVWPKEDARDVQLFVSLVHHVTGVKLRARFASEQDSSQCGRRVFGRQWQCMSMPATKDDGCDSGRSGGSEERLGLVQSFFRKSRRMNIRLKAHLFPYNSGLLAGEALVAPFFGVGRAPHADLPVCVEAAFPRAGLEAMPGSAATAQDSSASSGASQGR